MTGASMPLADEIAIEYLLFCERQNQPIHTMRRRRAVLRAVGNPGTITREELEDWWASRTHLRSGVRRADTSRANELAILRAFYHWCQVWERRHDNPTVRLTPPRPPSGAPKPVTRRELDLILAHVADDPPMRRAVLLGVWAGLRVSEAASLNWSDVDTDNRRARVTGKGRKTRIVSLSSKLLDALLPDTGGNVVTGRDRGLSGGTLGRKVNATIQAAGVDATYHKLRHRYGSVAYQRTRDPKALAEQMGHASVATTMSFYAAAADEAGQAIADAVSDD